MPNPVFASPLTNPFGISDNGSLATPTFADFDGNGIVDLIVGYEDGTTRFFRNTGTAIAPNFTEEPNSFGLPDVGAVARPAFVDIDKDGDLDAFVGKDDGGTEFFRNQGSQSSPTYVGETDNFGLGDVGLFAAPTFVDIDNDGDYDAFVGSALGLVRFFRNTGNDSSPQFTLQSSNFGITNEGLFASPSFADIDGDGLKDAVIGLRSGDTVIFRNNGTATAPSFVNVGNLGLGNAGQYVAPVFEDVDDDGDLDALIGNSEGNLIYYENTLKIRPQLNLPTAISYTDTKFDDIFAAKSGKLIASDRNGDSLTYGIVGGVDNGSGKISLLSTYGTLTVDKTTGDYSFVANDSAIEGLTANSSQFFEVSASDGDLTATQTLIINFKQLGVTESEGNDILVGTTANNRFNGLGGNDTINGAVGADIMRGGNGNDIYFVDNIGDKVIETNAGATQIDTVNSFISYTLPTLVERLVLVGTSIINGNGNTLNNTLIGNNSNNILNGRAGSDIMSGKLGNDTYYVDNSGDKVIEQSTLNTEIDRVISTVSHTLSVNVEQLVFTGNTAINGTGNASANLIIGNAGNNLLNGMAGNDLLSGGLGKDIFKWTQLSRDRITDFNIADDTIQLENAVFKKLTQTGELSADNFAVGAAQDNNDHVIYNPTNGLLTYDTNGNVAGGATIFAILTVGLALTNADIVVV